MDRDEQCASTKIDTLNRNVCVCFIWFIRHELDVYLFVGIVQ